MSVGRFLKYSFVAAAAVLGATTSVYAADPAVQQPVAFEQPDTQLASAVQPQDGLHKDKRWPKFAECINNTGTQDEFVSCLRTAFLADGTGTQVALLQH